MFHFPFSSGFAPFPPFVDGGDIVVGFVLKLGAPLFGESIGFVSRETARHVFPDHSVAPFACAAHKEFCAVVDLWDARSCQQKGDGLFPMVEGVDVILDHPLRVVVVKKAQHLQRVGIYVVEGKMVVDFV